MKLMLLLSLTALCTITLASQDTLLAYESSAVYPFGLPNPEAGDAIEDWSSMIGTCRCKSVRRNPDGSWKDTIDMDWTWKYILNGTAVQDISLKEGNIYSTSIRQFHPDSNQWVVTFFSYPGITTSPGTWRGARQASDMVLSKPQKAPNGMAGFSRLTFYEISSSGYKWKGEWLKEDGSVVYPFWTIDCRRE